ncbi:MAG: hypothetical protein GPOALKHO_000522 [Sodalis sp.]|nr:MAG: hypothetical protein GPOALKHO_000522 [Sodalis sp.]
MTVVDQLITGIDSMSTVVRPGKGHRYLAARFKCRRIGNIDPFIAAQAKRLASFAVGNSSGKIPIPIKSERWIRSKLSAITARIPSNRGPLAAQSRLEPAPYSGTIANGICSAA